MATYLALVNKAIKGSGVKLDPLTSSNFSTAGDLDSLYDDYKDWVNDAYREIQLERDTWESMSEKAVLVIRPRIWVYDGDLASGAPTIGSTLEGQQTEATFEIVSVTTIEGDWTAGSAEAFIDMDNVDGNLKLNELLDITSAPTATDVARVKGRGRYDFNSLISDFHDIKPRTMYIQSSTDNGVMEYPVAYCAWDSWVELYEYDMSTRERPLVYTETADGLFDFWPIPDQAYILNFEYSKDEDSLSAYDDTPDNLPVEYHDMVVWRAVMYAAEYEGNPSKFNWAQRRYMYYKKRMDEKQLPSVSFKGWRYV